MFLLTVNVVFLVDIESTIAHHPVDEDSQWTFGQTLAVLLLVLPLRHVFGFIMHVRKEKRHEKRHAFCTKKLKEALGYGVMEEVMSVVNYVSLLAEATGMCVNFPRSTSRLIHIHRPISNDPPICRIQR
jgi:hypothetical protein